MSDQTKSWVTLFQTPHGRIARPAGVKLMQIEFRHIMLRVDRRGFLEFKEFIDRLDTECNQRADSDRPYRQQIVVELPSGAIMTLDWSDVLELRVLLEGAERSLHHAFHQQLALMFLELNGSPGH